MQNSTSTSTSASTENSSIEVQVAESAQINPGLVATESGVGSRSSSFRNLVLPVALTLSSVGLGCSIVAFVAGRVYERPNPSTQFSNQTLARAREDEMERQEAILRVYQNAMIPIVTVGLVALVLQQTLSYMQRNGLIGPRRQMINGDMPISGVLGFNQQDRQEQLNNVGRPSPSLASREGENLGSAQLQQALSDRNFA